ncbi:hypothetical protein G6F68_014391 [Rhizopus microsporus]|nr:hypothetical protein G6F68_014391 [Rhizopus microsporus]
MYSEDIRPGSCPLPMMTSVDPPPMSMTSRLLGEGGRGGFGARQEIPRVAGDPERVGGNRADAVGVETAQAVAKALQDGDGAFDGVVAQARFGIQAGGKPDGFLETIDLIDLGRTVLLNDASDGEAEAVGPEVHRGQKLIHAARNIGFEVA